MEARSDTVHPPSIERERFLYRMSQIAALALILSVSAITFALINFVGLNPVVGDLEHRIDRLERTRSLVAGERRRGMDEETVAAVEIGAALHTLDDASLRLDPARRMRVRALVEELAAVLSDARVGLGEIDVRSPAVPRE